MRKLFFLLFIAAWPSLDSLPIYSRDFVPEGQLQKTDAPSSPSLPFGSGEGNQYSSLAHTNFSLVTLAQCFDEVLAHHPELLRFRKEVERAAGTKLELRARELPQLSAGMDAGWRNGPLYGNGGAYALITAQFSQPVFNTGMAASWRRGELEILATQQNLNSAVANVLQETRLYYLRAQRLEQLIALYEELDQRLQGNITSEQQRRDAGASGPRPVLQAKVQLLATRAELNSFRREEFEMRTRLAEIMARPMSQLPRPADTLAHESIALDGKAAARLAVQRRADLKFLRALIQMAREDRRVAQAGYFPFVSLVASTLYLPGVRRVNQATTIVVGQTPQATEARYGEGLTWQIVDNGQVTGVSRRIESIAQQYEVLLRRLEENIPRELSRLAHALEAADARLAALNKAVTEAEENLRLIQTRIALGEATQLEFSDAQRNLLAVRHGVIDALFQYDWALAELDWVTGRYLEFAEPVKER